MERIGDNQYENTQVFGVPLAWGRRTLGEWRQQCDDENFLERFPDFTVLPTSQEWDGEETLPERP